MIDYFIYCKANYNDYADKGIYSFIILDKNKKEIFRHFKNVDYSQEQYPESDNANKSYRVQYQSVIEAMQWIHVNIKDATKSNICLQMDFSHIIDSYNLWISSWEKRGWVLKKRRIPQNLDLAKKLFHIKKNYPLLTLKRVDNDIYYRQIREYCDNNFIQSSKSFIPDEYHCKKCKSIKYKLQKVYFKDNTEHLRSICLDCKKTDFIPTIFLPDFSTTSAISIDECDNLWKGFL